MERLQKETGLWLTNCDHEDELEDITLSCGKGCPVDAGYYLHGICGVFALALHDRYGYRIEWSLDDEEDYPDEDEESDEPYVREYDPWKHIIHIYCIDERQGLFIDVRGITQDKDRFFEPFEDFFTELGFYEPCEDDSHELREKLLETMGEDTLQFYYDCACRMIDLHPDWYRTL